MTRGAVPPPSRRERRAQARLEQPAARSRRTPRKQARPVWQSPVVLVSVAAVAIAIAVILFGRPPATTPRAELVNPPTSYPAALVDGEAVGAAGAPVVLELYADFQCPACRQFAIEQLPRLVSEFVQPGTLRIDARDIDILGTGSPSESLELAAGAACAAEQDRYWQFHDYVFWNQGRENRGDHDDAFIAAVAGQATVDASAFKACMAGEGVRDAIRAATSAAGGAGINSTPTLVVNGQRMVGVPDYAELAALIRSLASPAPAASPAPTGGS